MIGADGLHSEVRRLAFGPQHQFEKPLGYAVAAFEVCGYRLRDPGVYVIYGQPGLMLGRFTLHDDRTLFLFVFTADTGSLPATLDLQKAMLREKYAEGKWECPHILDDLDRAQELYFDRVSQIRMESWSRGRVALVGDAAFCVSLLAGQGSALAMTSAYALAGELTNAGGRYEEAFGNYEALLRDYINTKQSAADRFAGAFAPRTHWGLDKSCATIRRDNRQNPSVGRAFASVGDGQGTRDRMARQTLKVDGSDEVGPLALCGNQKICTDFLNQ